MAAVASVPLASALLAACGAGGMPPAEEGKVVVEANPPYGPEHMMSTAMTQFGDLVTEKSDGSMSFEYYFADSLLKQPEVAPSLNSGVIDLGYLGMAYTPAAFPVDAWASQLGYGGDSRPVVGLLASAAALVEWSYSQPAISAELEEAGVHPILPRFQNHDSYQMLCKDPVRSLDDVAGKRVRVGGQVYSEAVEELGMTPVSLSGAEIYEGFERGVVDCFVGGEPDMTGLGLWELGGNLTRVNFPGWNSISYASSTDFVNSLTPKQREVLLNNRAEFMRIYYEGLFEEQKRFYREGPEKGIQELTPDESLQRAIDDHFTAVRTGMIANAPAQIDDPQVAVAEFERLREKWTQIVVDLGYDAEVDSYQEWAAQSPDSFDLGPWADKLDEEIFFKMEGGA